MSWLKHLFRTSEHTPLGVPSPISLDVSSHGNFPQRLRQSCPLWRCLVRTRRAAQRGARLPRATKWFTPRNPGAGGAVGGVELSIGKNHSELLTSSRASPATQAPRPSATMCSPAAPAPPSAAARRSPAASRRGRAAGGRDRAESPAQRGGKTWGLSLRKKIRSLFRYIILHKSIQFVTLRLTIPEW